MTISVSKFLSSAFAACAVLALSAAPAPAASSSGAQTYVDNFCEDRVVIDVCRDGRGEFSVIQTPGGNTMYEFNAKYVYTYTVNGVFYYSLEGSDHFQHLFLKGEPQEDNSRWSISKTFEGQTCTSSYHYHFANGQVQFINDGFECVPA
jgi:hypothetical protein